MGNLILILAISILSAVIGSAIVSALYKDKFPDLHLYAGPIVLTGFIVALALGLIFTRYNNKSIKLTYDSAYKSGYESGYEEGKQDGYIEGYNECEVYYMTK